MQRLKQQMQVNPSAFTKKAHAAAASTAAEMQRLGRTPGQTIVFQTGVLEAIPGEEAMQRVHQCFK